jgi:hypothetical protein
MSRAALTAVLAWLAAVVCSTTIGLFAVGAIGSGIVGPAQPTLSAEEVQARLAAATPSPVVTPAPPPPGNAPEVLASQGGTVVARCGPEGAEVESATPAQGYQIHDSDGGRVRFEADEVEVEIELSCRDGRPVQQVEIDD